MKNETTKLSPALGQQVVPDTRGRLRAMGGEPNPGTPEQTAEFLRAEYARWGRVIRESGIKAD